MATDTKISALPANPGVTPTDVVEVLDVSNTTNQATGENTRATVAGLVAGLPVMVASGTGHAAGLVPDPGASAGTTRYLREDATFAVPPGGGASVPFVPAGAGHAAGLVPDPGATSHATPYVLGDDGTFHPMLGSGLSYSGGGYTFSGGTGGSGTVTSITVSSPLTGGVITTAGTIGLGTVPVASGGTGLVALPTANQILGVNAGATAYEGKTLAAGSNITITPTAGVLTIAASGGGGARSPVFALTGIGGLKTGSTPVTLLSGGSFAGTGSLTIPANRLAAGSRILVDAYGDLAVATGDTLTFTVKLGGVTILTGTSGTAGSTVTGRQWFLRDFSTFFLVGGASGSCRSNANFGSAGTIAPNTTLAMYLTTAGNGDASNAVAVDCTAAQTLDIVINFSTANAADTLRILGMCVYIDG